jgi:hypothetical protein
MTPKTPETPDVATFVNSLIEVVVEQETAALTALQAGLQAAVHPRTEAEVEDDQDNLPI